MKKNIFPLFLTVLILQFIFMSFHGTPVSAAENEPAIAPQKQGEENVPSQQNGSPQPFIRGNAPEGFTLSYSVFMPLADDFKDIYSLLIGGTIGYLYPLDKNLALAGSAFCLTGESDSGDSRTTSTGGAIGARAGLPLFDFMYPYLGVSARGSWLCEQGKSDTVNFFAWDIDALAGIAFLFGNMYGVNLECAYAFGRVTDESATDVSGLCFNGGIIVKIW